MIGLPVTERTGERGAATGIAVELRQEDSVERDSLLERGRDVHGLLTRHRVQDEQDVRRFASASDPFELVHQRVVDV